MIKRLKKVLGYVLVTLFGLALVTLLLVREKGGRPSLLAEIMKPGISLHEVLIGLFVVAAAFYAFDDANRSDPP